MSKEFWVQKSLYRSLTRPRANGFKAWHIKTTSVYLARCPRNQFSRAIVIARHENCRLCSRKAKHQQNLCAFAPLSAEQLWLQLSEHRISFTRWPRTQNLVISLKTQPAFSPCLPAPSPSAALGCDGSIFPTKGGSHAEGEQWSQDIQSFCTRPDKYSWCNCVLKSCFLN